jgi:DNA-binding transcriptional ArsR family regulator
MNDDDPALGLGKLQKDILLWLGEEAGITTRSDIRRMFPKKKHYPYESNFIPSRMLSSITSIQEGFSKMIAASVLGNPLIENLANRAVEVDREEPYLRDEYFAVAEVKKTSGTRWSPKRFLGRRPSNSESVSISESLRRLEERGLITLYRFEGKKVRVSHIALTPKGMAASVKIRMQKEAAK